MPTNPYVTAHQAMIEARDKLLELGEHKIASKLSWTIGFFSIYLSSGVDYE